MFYGKKIKELENKIEVLEDNIDGYVRLVCSITDIAQAKVEEIRKTTNERLARIEGKMDPVKADIGSTQLSFSGIWHPMGDLNGKYKRVDEPSDDCLDIHIAYGYPKHLSSRAYKCLDTAGIISNRLLIENTKKDLMNLPHFGAVSLKQVEEYLAVNGLELKEE